MAVDLGTIVDKVTRVTTAWLQYINDTVNGLANTTDAAKGDALIANKRTDIAGVATNLHAWMNAQIFNVKSDGGAIGDGVADDTAAIQATADKIAAFQNAQITAQKLTKAVLYFPDGNYTVSDATKIRGFIAIMGTGTSYTGGSVIRQTVAGKNIFEFYGSTNDNTSLGVTVEGMNFEFASSLPSSLGIALYFPKFNDIVPTQVQSSNSHYIRRNRFGGWHRKGRFLKMERCNDVEISSNVIDVVETGAAVELGVASDAASVCTDVRVFGNNFFFCFIGIALRNVAGVTIGKNSYSTQFANDWTGIDMNADGGAITPGRVTGVVIANEEFSSCHTCFRFDGSARDISIGPCVYTDQKDYPFVTEGATDIERLQIIGGSIKVASTYTRIALMQIIGSKIKNSSICDLLINANGVNALNALGLEQSGPISPFGAGMTLRNNRIFGNTITAPGANYQLVPCTADSLVLEDVQVFPTTYPTAAPVFNMNTLVVQDSVSFILDYEVEVNKSGDNVGTRTGSVKVSILRIRNAGTLVSNIFDLGSVGDDFNGLGGANIPTVTFAVTTGTPATVTVTATATMAAPVIVTVRCRAHSFRGTGNVQIKSA